MTALLGIAWTAGIAFGFRMLFAYERKPATESRGHAGDNTGERTIEALVNNQSPTPTATFVFGGCPLANHSDEGGKARCLK